MHLHHADRYKCNCYRCRLVAVVTDEGVITGVGTVTDEGVVTGEGVIRGVGVVPGEGVVTGEGVVPGEGVVTGEGVQTGMLQMVLRSQRIRDTDLISVLTAS